MGWDKGRYYTRSKKVNGRVVREYIGSGIVAVCAAQIDAIDRVEKAERRAALRDEREQFDTLAAALMELDDLADRLAAAAMMAAGYHRHHRGEWRKKRA